MSFVLTYNTLLTTIPNYLERNDPNLLATIPVFILLAQNRISKDAEDGGYNLGQQQYITGNFTPNNPVLIKPNDWKSTLSINYGVGVGNNTKTQLRKRKYEFLIDYWSNETEAAPPQFYADDYGYFNWFFAPTPDQAYPVLISYYQVITPIDLTNQTNWLTQFEPQLLLYACLLEAMIYLKDDERIQYWQGFYDRALAALNKENSERMADRYSDGRRL